MTLEEAKKILEEEGFKLGGPGKPGVISEAFAEYESPEICEAMQIVCSAGFQLAMLAGVFDERKARLKKEYGKNHIKGDFSGNKSIEHCGEPAPGEEQPKENSLKAATDAFILQANEIMRLKKKNAELLEAIDKMKEGNPALKESASQFNDALLDEQAKKIAELTKEKSNLEDKIAVLNACKKHNDKIDRKQIKCLGKEISKLNGIIHKKNLKIEELEKECFRHLSGKVQMFGENVDLEQMLKDKDAILSDVAEELRLSKIREKNLTEVCQKYMKENEELKEELADKVVDKINANALKSAESALAYKEKVIAEKDEVIADLGNELEATKKELEAFKESYKRRIKEDSEHFEHIQKICNAGLQKWLIESEYLEKDKPFRFPKHDIASGKENKKPRIPTPEEPKHDNRVKDFISKTIDNFNRRAANLGCVGSNDGNGIIDQMVGADIAEEGADNSGTIVICGKDFVKKFKENEESLSEFLKNIEDEAVESMSIESGHLGGNESFGQMEAVKPSQRFKQAVCDARLELLYFIS